MSGGRQLESHPSFNGGMIRDEQRHQLPRGAVYDADNMLFDVRGKARRRGGTAPLLGTLHDWTPQQVIAVHSKDAGGCRAIVGMRNNAAGQSVARLGIGASSAWEILNDTSASARNLEIGRPFTYRGLGAFPILRRSSSQAYTPVNVYTAGGSARTGGAPTLASIACTAGSSVITAAAADVAAMGVGDWVNFGTATNVYNGYVTRLLTSTTFAVNMAPHFTMGAGTCTTAGLGNKLAAAVNPASGAVVGAKAGCGYQNRIMLGAVRVMQGTTSEFKPNRLVWSVTPAETMTWGSVTFGGFVQGGGYGFAQNNFADLDVKEIVGVVPGGEAQLLIIGSDRCVAVVGNFSTINDANQSLYVDADPFADVIGCMSDRSIQETPTGPIWAAREGVFTVNGSRIVNLMGGRITRLWDGFVADPTFQVYGSAIVKDHYIVSTSKGGLVCSLRDFAWGRYTGPTIGSSTIDPLDTTKVYACKWVDPAAATIGSAEREQVYRLDTLFTDDRPSDHDGTAVESSLTSGAYPMGDAARLKRLRRVTTAVDLKAPRGFPSLNLDIDNELFLPNADAEFGSAEWWRPYANGATALPTLTADAAVKRTGGYSIKVVTDGANGAGDGVVYDLDGARSDGLTTYAIEVWVNLTTAGTLTLTFNGATTTTTTTGSWVQLLLSSTITSGDVTGLNVQITHSANGATFYVDDLHVAMLQPWEIGAVSGSVATGAVMTRDTQNAAPNKKAALRVVVDAASEGTRYRLRGTFKAGITYTVSVRLKGAGTYNNAVRVGMGSVGTSDSGSAVAPSITTAYRDVTATWTPTADRTDAALFVADSGGAATMTLYIGFAVWTGPNPNVSVGAIGGLDGEGDDGDGVANDSAFADFTNDYAIESGSGLTASGGQLVPSSTAAKIVRYRRGEGRSRDGEVVVGFISTASGDTVDALLTYIDVSNQLGLSCTDGGGASIYKRVAGLATTLKSASIGASIPAGAPGWIVGRRDGLRLTVELYNVDPALGGTPLGTPLVHDLSTSDAALFNDPGSAGFRLFLGSTNFRVEDYRFTPYGNIGAASSDPSGPSGLRGTLHCITRGATVTFRQRGAAQEFECGPLELEYDLLRPGR